MNIVALTATAVALCLAGAASGLALQGQSQAPGEACSTDEAIVLSIKEDLADTVGTVSKESLDAFQKAFHEQACVSKLSICLDSVQSLLTCLGKAVHDSGTAKADLNACKAKQAAYRNLKSVLQQDIAELRAAKDPKTAKDDIEKFNFSH
jgi:hypothetical protein